MRKLIFSAVAALAAVALAVPALAQNKGAGKYAAGIFESPANGTNFTMPGKAKGKIQIKPSKKDLDGGWTIQLNVKGIDCVAEDASEAGKCGIKGVPIGGHRLELNTFALGALAVAVGIEYQIEGGKTTFVESGKNKTGVGGGGALVSILYNTVLGIDGVRLRGPASDPFNVTTGCGVIPLPPVNTCIDGPIYAIAGILVGEDLGLPCAATSECGSNPVLVCNAPTCEIETCSADADCDQNGGGTGGTGECDCGAGACCDPLTDPGCAAICG